MTNRHPGLSPEELADLRKREASERDTTRTRNTERAFGEPTIVEHWPCGGCGAMVGMTRDAIDLHAIFNRELVKRREQPLSKRSQCTACKQRDEKLESARRQPHEQREMPLGNSSSRDELPSGMRTKRPQHRSRR